jgi:putative tryptophan/tyrosine transport system substrate-binding protein
MIGRRRFVQGAGVAGLGLLAGCGRGPGQDRGQSRTLVPRIGVLWTNEPATVDAFREGLRELGYVEGEAVHLEYRFTIEERPDEIRGFAAELVRLPVDVLVTQGMQAIRVAQQATSDIPIVMAAVGDAVGLGLVASLARPGGNTTGLSFLAPELAVKQLEMLKETIPDLARVAVLRPIQGALTVLQGVQAAAPVLGLTLQVIDVQGPEDLDGAFRAAQEGRAEALHVLTSPVFLTHRTALAELAAAYRLPAMYPQRTFVAAGGLMGYGPSIGDQYRRAAYYVDKILKGAKPADLPVEQPIKFDFSINLQTAQALGLTIPPHVLLQATEIIQ